MTEPQFNFAGVLQHLGRHDCMSAALPLQMHGIRSISMVADVPLQTLTDWVGDAALAERIYRSLVPAAVPTTASVVPVRKDTNILKPSRRGHMSMAICAAERRSEHRPWQIYYATDTLPVLWDPGILVGGHGAPSQLRGGYRPSH